MAFNETRILDTIAQGSRGGPGFNTGITPLDSGAEQRLARWSQQRHAWNIGYGISNKETYTEVLEFFYAQRGRFDGFRFKDFSDFELARQQIGTTDGSTATFQIFKRYTKGTNIYDRTLKKIVTGSETVWVNNVQITEGAGAGEYQLNDNTGIITLGSTLAAQSATAVEVLCQFDVPVRFDTDQFDITLEQIEAGAIPNLPIIELR